MTQLNFMHEMPMPTTQPSSTKQTARDGKLGAETKESILLILYKMKNMQNKK